MEFGARSICRTVVAAERNQALSMGGAAKKVSADAGGKGYDEVVELTS